MIEIIQNIFLVLGAAIVILFLFGICTGAFIMHKIYDEETDIDEGY